MVERGAAITITSPEKLHWWIILGGVGAILGGLVLLFLALFGDTNSSTRLLLGAVALFSAAFGLVTLAISSFGTRWTTLTLGEKVSILPGIILGWPGLLLFAAFLVVFIGGELTRDKVQANRTKSQSQRSQTPADPT